MARGGVTKPTGVEGVERFYSSNLTAEMSIDLLQGKPT